MTCKCSIKDEVQSNGYLKIHLLETFIANLSRNAE